MSVFAKTKFCHLDGLADKFVEKSKILTLTETLRFCVFQR